MSTPSYATFVRRHHAAHPNLHADAQQIAEAAADWIDLMARGMTEAVAAPLHLKVPALTATTDTIPARPGAAGAPADTRQSIRPRHGKHRAR